MSKKLSIGFAILLGTQIAVADDLGWQGEGELGFTNTSGNTETESLLAKLSLGYKQTSWEHNLKFEALRAEDNKKLTAERYGANLQSDYKMSKHSYLFGKLRYEEDHFSSYDYQGSFILGYGNHVIDTERTSLKLEIGAGVNKNELELDNVTTQSQEQAVAYAGLNFSQKIGTHSEFTQDIRVEGGEDNVYTESDTGFKVNIMENLAMKLSVLVKHNSEVAAEKKKTDTVTAVTVVYGF